MMRSIRRRLTIGYVVALGLTLTLFGVVLYVDRRQADFQSLDDRLEVEAQLTLRMLRDLSRSLGRLPPVVESVQQYFQGFAHYLVLVGSDQNIILVIDPVGSLGNETVGRLRELTHLIKDATPAWTTTTITTGQSPVRFYVAPVIGADPAIRYMLVGASLDEVSFGPAALLRSMLLVAPVVLLVSVVIGSWLAGTSLYPLESTIDELTAITDGRSLHRRLPVNPSGTDELTRLSQAVNGMFARLEQSFAAQQRFVAEASHELKTPLMVLRVGVERALTDPTTPNDNLEALDQSLEEINRMSELVDSLLTLARADEGRVPLAVERRDLRELVNEAAETAQILGEAKSLTIRSEVPAQPVFYPIDRTRMRQLLLNLITNAVKYTPDGGGVTVSLAGGEDVVQIIVADTGMGIAAGDLPHIFDRFWRADPARARDTGGTGAGLGLAITKWIAEAHGGSISVQSRPGKGATFTVSLPHSDRGTENAGE